MGAEEVWSPQANRPNDHHATLFVRHLYTIRPNKSNMCLYQKIQWIERIIFDHHSELAYHANSIHRRLDHCRYSACNTDCQEQCVISPSHCRPRARLVVCLAGETHHEEVPARPAGMSLQRPGASSGHRSHLTRVFLPRPGCVTPRAAGTSPVGPCGYWQEWPYRALRDLHARSCYDVPRSSTYRGASSTPLWSGSWVVSSSS